MLKHFPPLTRTFLQMIGPSVIFAALSISGGEMLLWPNLVANYGLNILWPIPLVLLLQFAVNIEIERYTLVTGKSVESSLLRNAPWLSGVFALTVLIALMWPAWMTTAGNLVAVLLGFSGNAIHDVGLVAAIVMLAMSGLVFYAKKTYRVLERLAQTSVVIALVIILFVVVLRFDTATFLAGIRGFTAWGFIPPEMPRFDFVAALAYGGVAGVLNLVQSEWIQAKGYGVNTLSASAISKIDFATPQSRTNFRAWFRAVNIEHFLFFVIATIGSLFLLAYLGALVLPHGSAQGFAVLTQEIAALNNHLPLLGTAFGIAGIMIFFMANVTILDAIGRLTSRILTSIQSNTPSRTQQFIASFTASRISVIALLLGIAILCASIVIPQLKQPFFLLVLSASLSALTMWLYPPLLLKLNAHLPAITRPSLIRSSIVIIATLCYGAITLWALSDFVPMVVVVLLGTIITLWHVTILLSMLRDREQSPRRRAKHQATR